MKDVFKIKLDIADINEFINVASSISNDINLFQGNTIASGKSLVGLYSLDLTREINLIIHNRINDDIVYENFGKWIIE